MKVIWEVFIALFINFMVHRGVPSEQFTLVPKFVHDFALSITQGLLGRVRKIEYRMANMNEKTDEAKTTGIFRGLYQRKKQYVTKLEKYLITKKTPIASFYLVKAENRSSRKKIEYNQLKEIARAKGKIIFLIHGWRANMSTPWYHYLSKLLIKRRPDAYLVMVSWPDISKQTYFSAALHSELVGNLVGNLITRLVKKYEVLQENIFMIGHSLGSHIAGFAGKRFIERTGKKLARIIALDPAAPYFVSRRETERLNMQDAEVVLVIHTCAGTMGFPTKMGTIDFFPNGGANQPGCENTMEKTKIETYFNPLICNHRRAWELYLEAINSTGSLPARKCDSYEDFNNGECRGEIVAMSDLETNATGSFYLNTSSTPPYSQPLPFI